MRLSTHAAEGGSDEQLLLIPGIGCDADVFAELGAGRVFTVDATSIGSMSDTILTAAPPRFGLLGHSMGGYVALAMIDRAPERVTRLALVSTSGAPDGSTDREARIAVPTLVLAGASDRIIAPRAFRSAGPVHQCAPRAV